MDLGINNFTTKSIAQYPKAATSYLGKMLAFRSFLFVIYAVISFTIALTLGWSSNELYLLSFLVLNQFFVTLIAYARSHFGGLLMFKTDAVISVLDRFLLILICGALIYFPSTDQAFKIEWFVWAQTLCYGTTFIIAFSLLIRKIGLPKLSHKRLFSYAVIRKSFPYALLILLMMIYTRVDSVMIERMHPNGKEEAGYYAQGFRLLDAFFMFAMIFSNLLFPLFSKILSKQQPVHPLLSTSGKLLIGGAMAIGALCYFNGELILGTIYDEHIQESMPSFQLLMLAFIGMCSSLIFGTLLTANGSLRFLNQLSAAGILVNLIVNWLLIPTYGAYGAAIATVSTQGVIALIQFIYAMRTFQLGFSWKITAQFIGFITAIIFANSFFEIDSLLLLLALALSHLLALFAFKLIDFRALRTTLFSQSEKEI